MTYSDPGGMGVSYEQGVYAISARVQDACGPRRATDHHVCKYLQTGANPTLEFAGPCYLFIWHQGLFVYSASGFICVFVYLFIWHPGLFVYSASGFIRSFDIRVSTSAVSNPWRTSMHDKYSGSMKITTHLDHISHCKIASGQKGSNAWKY